MAVFKVHVRVIGYPFFKVESHQMISVDFVVSKDLISQNNYSTLQEEWRVQRIWAC